MPTMHIQEELDERMIALGYEKRTQRITFVNEAVEHRLEREEERRKREEDEITLLTKAEIREA